MFTGERVCGSPALADRSHFVAACFGERIQHDIFEFLEAFLWRVHYTEVDACRSRFWGGVQAQTPYASHADRIFGFVMEKRGECMRCHGCVRSWFTAERVLRLLPSAGAGVPMTVPEMYLKMCAP